MIVSPVIRAVVSSVLSGVVWPSGGSGGSIIEVANEAERLALTGISPGQQVRQLDNSVIYTLNAPSTAQGGVFVSGGAQDGIYTERGTMNNVGLVSTFFNLLGSPTESEEGFNCISELGIGGAGPRKWTIQNADGDPVYYSLSDVATPDLATDWKNASDDSPASITVTAVTQGELDAGVTVSGAGDPQANVTMPRDDGGAASYTGYRINDSFNQLYNTDGYWQLYTNGEQSVYVSTPNSPFPWGLTYFVTGMGDAPAPTVTRNDIAAPNNWSAASTSSAYLTPSGFNYLSPAGSTYTRST